MSYLSEAGEISYNNSKYRKHLFAGSLQLLTIIRKRIFTSFQGSIILLTLGLQAEYTAD